VTTAPIARPGRWALPPQPPETWVGGTAGLLLLLGIAVSLTVPSLALLPDDKVESLLLAVVYVIGSLLSLSAAYLLAVQASVTQDRRLAWAGVGYATLWLVYQARCVNPALPVAGGNDEQVTWSVMLSLAWLLSLPVAALTAGLRHRGRGLLVVPPLLVAALVAAAAVPYLSESPDRLRTLSRGLALAAAGLAGAAAAWWRHRVPLGNRGAWGWVGASLMLTPVVGVMRTVTIGEGDPLAWPALGVELLAVGIATVGLWTVTASGYRRQAAQWRRLETDVRALRASSPLLPGLSITPHDDDGLPEREDVLGLLARTDTAMALQPVVALASGSVVGHEALARFQGRVPTERWFRSAGLWGLGHELERLTLALALRELAFLPEEEFLAVNASPAALHDDDIRRQLLATDLRRVVVEITEHDAVNDYAWTRRVLAELRAEGARIAVDDVGAGFASLHHVLLLQPDVIKLDYALTREIHENSTQLTIVRSVVSFADEVGAVVLAEGIEVEAQIPPLVEAGVTLGQGWHLGIPVMPSR
jgi:EAL domain-containing protein (putative c-di-GMP-specific phosphodiesterase class I)